LDNGSIIDGVFLTHAHIGHYTGLMFLGHEAMGAKSIPVYAMPKMKHYLETNGPWSQLVNFKNIQLQNLQNDSVVSLDNQLKVTPFTVPHRDEYSETVGYKIEGRKKSALFIPDINKWHLWDKDIVEEVKKVDYAFLDATFYKDGEIPRPMSEVQHPFIEETIALFANETKAIKQKIVFIHFNHSNPTLHKNNASRKELEALGFGFATEGEVYPL
jgi:pyrroloquinoline quinone biosynthesis protein B